ncbi:MAG: LPS assembly protein LptD [Opitutales bacterium]
MTGFLADMLGRFFIVTSLLIGLSTGSAQIGNLPSFEADRSSFDAERGVMVAEGDVVVVAGDLRLEANRIEVAQGDTTVRAFGNVTLTRGAFRIVAPEASYNYKSGEFSAENIRMGAYPYYISAKRLFGTEADVRVEEATIYFFTPSRSGLRIGSDSVRLQDQETLVLEEAVFRAGPVPFFVLDEFSQPVDEPLPFAYRGDAGFQNDLGAFWQNQLLVRAHPGWWLGGNFDAYTRRGVLGGPAAEIMVEDNVKLEGRGSFDSGFIYDLGSDGRLGTGLTGQPIDPFRYFIEGTWQGTLAGEFDLTADLHAWSDSESLRDFRNGVFRENQYPFSFLEGTWRGDNSIVTGLIEGPLVEGVTATERLPSIGYVWFPSHVGGTRLVFEGFADYSHLRVEDTTLNRDPTLESNRFQSFAGVRYPIDLTPWARLTPRLGALVSAYVDTKPTDDSLLRAVGEIGFDLEAVAAGTFDISSEVWRIDGLRHTLAPRLSYRYLPGAESSADVIPPIDRPAGFEIYPETLDLARRHDYDYLGSGHIVRLGLEQTLDTRQPDYGARELLSLEFLQDFRIQRRDIGATPLAQEPRIDDDIAGDFFAKLRLTPAYWLSGELRSRWGWGSGVNGIGSRLSIQDGDQWTVAFGNEFVGDFTGDRDIHQYLIEAAYRINQRNEFLTLFRIDANDGRLAEHSYAWRTRVENAWDLEFRVTGRTGNEREGSYTVGVQARLLTF